MASPEKQAPEDPEDAEVLELDEALTRIGLGWGQGWSMAVMSLLWFGETLQLFVMFYLPQALKDDWKTPPNVVAWLDFLLFLGVALGAILGGMCSDKVGRKPTVLWSAFFATCFGFYNAYASSFQELCIMRFALGGALGAFGPASMSMTLETCPASLRGKYGMAIPGFSGVAGKIAVALIADSLYDTDYNAGYLRFTWRSVLVLCAFPTFLGLCLGVYVLSESPRWLLVVHGQPDEAATALHNLALKNSNGGAFPKGTRLVPATVEEHDDAWVSIQRVFQQPLLLDTFSASMALIFFAVVYYGLIYILPIYLRPWADQNGWTAHEQNMGLVIVACSEAPALAAMIFTIDLEHVGRRYSVVAAALATTASCLLINFHALVGLFHSSFGIIGSNFLARGCAQAALAGATLFVAEVYPTGSRGAAISISITAGRLGASASPFVADALHHDSATNEGGGGGMWVDLSPLRIYVFYALAAAAAAGCFLAVGPWEPAGARLPDTAGERSAASSLAMPAGWGAAAEDPREKEPLLPRAAAAP